MEKKIKMPDFDTAVNMLLITGNRRCVAENGCGILGIWRGTWDGLVCGDVECEPYDARLVTISKKGMHAGIIPIRIIEILKQ